jgi:hypothetical protein
MAATVTTWNKGKAPAGTTGWQLTPDVRAGLESLNVVVPVANKAERDGITPPLGKYVGMAVSRADLRGRIEIWDGTTWRAPAPIGLLSSVTNAGQNLVGITLNNMLETTVAVGASRHIEVCATIDGESSMDAMFVGYTLAYGGTGTGGTPIRTATMRYTTANLGEAFEVTAIITTAAEGNLRFNLQAQVTIPATGPQGLKSNAGNTRLTVIDLGPA